VHRQGVGTTLRALSLVDLGYEAPGIPVGCQNWAMGCDQRFQAAG
jgi:hypothetical protein